MTPRYSLPVSLATPRWLPVTITHSAPCFEKPLWHHLEPAPELRVFGEHRGDTVAPTHAAGAGRVCNIWRIRDGKAVRLEVYADTGLMWKAFGKHPPDRG